MRRRERGDSEKSRGGEVFRDWPRIESPLQACLSARRWRDRSTLNGRITTEDTENTEFGSRGDGEDRDKGMA
jgi:hypothetical protein